MPILVFLGLSVVELLCLIGGGIKRCFCLTSVCRIHGHKSRIERPRKTEIGTEIAHVTRDSGITVKIKRSRSPGCFNQRDLHG